MTHELQRPTLRAIHYISAFFPQPRGAAYAARALARGLRDRGVKIEFIVDAQSGDWDKGGAYEGFPIRSFTLSLPGKLRKIRGLAKASRYVWRKRNRVDLVHIHGGDFVTIAVGWCLAQLCGAKALLKITSNGLDTPEGIRSGRHGWLVSRLYKRLDAVVAMTSGQKKTTRDWGYPGMIEIIPNGVDTERFKPASSDSKRLLREELGIPEDVPVLCYSGWLGEGKGSDILFRTWVELRKEHPEIRLLLIGNFFHDEGRRTEFGEWLGSVGVDAALLEDPLLVNAGMTEHPEHILPAADVFMFPSWQEGFGTVQIEAMACGLPCVVHELPGVNTDIFPDDRIGIRLKENTSEAFLEPIQALLRDPARREAMGHAARDFVVRAFDQKRIIDQYFQFYHELAKS